MPLYQGHTDNQGTANVSFKVPAVADPSQTLVIETRSSLGSDTVERPVTVQRDYRVLLTTDKPIYQPGQVIHLRALALSTFDLQPAAGPGAGSDHRRRQGQQGLPPDADHLRLTARPATDFQLASEVNTGAYKISAVLGNTSSEKTVTVENYVLPKFDVKLETEKHLLPARRAACSGTLSANYFFGKPVAGGKVQLEGYTFDVQRNVACQDLDGKTDEQGNYHLRIRPARLPGRQRAGQAARRASTCRPPSPTWPSTPRPGRTFAAGLSQRAGDRGHPRRRLLPRRAWRTSSTCSGQLPGRLPRRSRR